MKELDFNNVKDSIKVASNYLSKNKTIINNLNVFPVPDGDTGTNMNMTIKSALKVADESDASTIYEYLKNFSRGSLLGARGNSGVILSQLIRGFVDAVPKDAEVLEVKDIVQCFQKSTEVAYNAVMKPTEGTILTVSKDISRAAKKYSKSASDVSDFMKYICEEGNKSLNRTPELLPILKESGVVDAGGKGLMIFLEGISAFLSDNVEILSEDEEDLKDISKSSDKPVESEIQFGYCTEFILKTNTTSNDIENTLRNYFSQIGDSIVVVAEDGNNFVKVHLHTNHPGKALEKALEFGSLNDIKVDNMKYQHNEVLKKIVENEHIENAFISVSSGDGFDSIFKSLGVSKIISGGQTMNPSTSDILQAVENTNATNIYILPNNKNIILSAKQVVDLTDKNVYVVPTKTMPEGITAVLNGFNFEDPDESFESIVESIDYVKTGEITYAVRGTKYNGSDIKEGEIIGITDSEIISKGESIEDVSLDLIDKMMNDDFSLLSIYYGRDVTEESAMEFHKKVSEKYDDIDVEIVYGGQSLYYYIFSLE